MNLLPMTPRTADDTNREAAESMYAMYRSYVDAGFSRAQAMQIITTILAEQARVVAAAGTSKKPG